MNLIIIEPKFHIDSKHIKLCGRHHQHIKTILKAKTSSILCIGELDGAIGEARILEINENDTIAEIVQLEQNAPATLPLTLVLGLPRPRMLQRTLQTIATMGVERLCLIQTSRVEKSFWQTPLLKPETVREQLILGLEQGKATQMPKIEFFQRFRPFIEDELPQKTGNFCNKWIAHPGDYPIAASAQGQATMLAIGPEGGFIDKEVAAFCDLGFDPIQLGQRILRVETAVPVLLAKLF